MSNCLGFYSPTLLTKISPEIHEQNTTVSPVTYRGNRKCWRPLATVWLRWSPGTVAHQPPTPQSCCRYHTPHQRLWKWATHNSLQCYAGLSELMAADTRSETMVSHSKSCSCCCSPCNVQKMCMRLSTLMLFRLIAWVWLMHEGGQPGQMYSLFHSRL